MPQSHFGMSGNEFGSVVIVCGFSQYLVQFSKNVSCGAVGGMKGWDAAVSRETLKTNCVGLCELLTLPDLPFIAWTD